MDQLTIICQRHEGAECSICSGRGYTTYYGKFADAVAGRLAAATAEAAADHERAPVERTLPGSTRTWRPWRASAPGV